MILLMRSMMCRRLYESSSRRVSTLHPNARTQKNRRNFLHSSGMRLNIFRGGECGSHLNASNDVFTRFGGANTNEHLCVAARPGGNGTTATAQGERNGSREESREVRQGTSQEAHWYGCEGRS
jgi:hypothetical protein